MQRSILYIFLISLPLLENPDSAPDAAGKRTSWSDLLLVALGAA